MDLRGLVKAESLCLRLLVRLKREEKKEDCSFSQEGGGMKGSCRADKGTLFRKGKGKVVFKEAGGERRPGIKRGGEKEVLGWSY